MMCKSKHFFRDTEYLIYEKEDSIEIGKVYINKNTLEWLAPFIILFESA